MKIVQFVEAFGGGVYTYVKDLCNFIAENTDDKIYLIYSPNRVQFKKELFLSEINPKVILIELDIEKEITIKKDISIYKKTKKILKEIEPDIIHLHSSKASVLGRIAAFNIVDKNNIFYSPHGYSFLRMDISILKQKFYKLIEKYSQSIFGGITIACGDTEYIYAKEIGQSKLVRNGINIGLVEQYYSPINNNKLTFGIVGRITNQKNPKLFNNIALQFPKHQFIWIGDGELKHELTAPNIKITGWFFNSEEVFKELNNIDIFLQTSLWEGLPLALLEAMALKKPIVSTNVVGNKDIVVNNRNGYLFENIYELDPLIRNLENKDFRNNMGEEGHKICLEKFNDKKNFQELYELYKL